MIEPTSVQNPNTAEMNTDGLVNATPPWTLQYREEHKELENRTLDKLFTAFTECFAPQVRTKKEETTQDLLDGKLKMDVKKGLVEYIARFREKIHLTRLKDLTYACRYFEKVPALQKACKANYRGSEFESLEDNITHAIGKNKKLDSSSEAQNSEAVLNHAAYFKHFTMHAEPVSNQWEQQEVSCQSPTDTIPDRSWT
ncbi:hypothetical protein Vretifemale_14500 [Volvox reticuliferus]|uniref:Uncharacterized protein n=1 Tax=Volvox reticuliferus TaxID=1737510 RepID=A0A8J4FU66_9CHLO|nr:hypothetical protein Vretifemale_14500 [Volvox reticuliferus]